MLVLKEPEEGTMRQSGLLLVVVGMLLMGSQPAHAGVVDSLQDAGVWLWNRIPATIELVNTGVHHLHDLTHAIAEALAVSVE